MKSGIAAPSGVVAPEGRDLAKMDQASSAGRDLSAIGLLADLAKADRKTIEKHCEWHEISAGEPIFNRGDASDRFYFVVTGRVRAVSYRSGTQEVAFANIAAGGTFGELSAIDGQPRSASVIALDDSLVASLSRDDFTELLNEKPKVCFRLLAELARVVRSINDRVVDLSTLSPVQRIYGELLRASQPDPIGDGSWLIDPMPRHEEMASWVGTTPETVARALGQLMKLGLVKRRSKALHIIDKPHLQKLAAAT